MEHFLWRLFWGSGRSTARTASSKTYQARVIFVSKVLKGSDDGVCKGADKSLTFLISYFPICNTTKIIFLEWVTEVRTTKL
jgi:hypothetical protein